MTNEELTRRLLALYELGAALGLTITVTLTTEPIYHGLYLVDVTYVFKIDPWSSYGEARGSEGGLEAALEKVEESFRRKAETELNQLREEKVGKIEAALRKVGPK